MFTRKEIYRRYHLKHKEQIRIKNKKWRETNPEYAKQWAKDNRKKLNRYNNLWRRNNPEKAKAHQDKYRMNNLESRREQARHYQSKKRKSDPTFRINGLMSSSLRRYLKDNTPGGRWLTFVDYTIQQLATYLKNTIPHGYTWKDFIDGKLHLEHKIPKSLFNFSEPEHIDFKRCWSLHNLQLLPAHVNQRKYNKLSQPFQPSLKI